jgi:hypothetical protein
MAARQRALPALVHAARPPASSKSDAGKKPSPVSAPATVQGVDQDHTGTGSQGLKCGLVADNQRSFGLFPGVGIATAEPRERWPVNARRIAIENQKKSLKQMKTFNHSQPFDALLRIATDDLQ